MFALTLGHRLHGISCQIFRLLVSRTQDVIQLFKWLWLTLSHPPKKYGRVKPELRGYSSFTLWSELCVGWLFILSWLTSRVVAKKANSSQPDSLIHYERRYVSNSLYECFQIPLLRISMHFMNHFIQSKIILWCAAIICNISSFKMVSGWMAADFKLYVHIIPFVIVFTIPNRAIWGLSVCLGKNIPSIVIVYHNNLTPTTTTTTTNMTTINKIIIVILVDSSHILLCGLFFYNPKIKSC